jgi:hypothetical protein
MSTAPGPPEPGDERPPSWMGAPGYQPHRELPPHAPMPGAPPYPAMEDHPPPPVGVRRPNRAVPIAIVSVLVAAVLNAVLELVVDGPARAASATPVIIVVGAVTAVLVALPARRWRWAPWVVAVASVAGYFVLRALSTLVWP